MLGYFGDLGEMRYDDVVEVFKKKAIKWNLQEPDEDVLLLNIKRWERQKAKKNPNIKQNILDYKHHEELYEAMRNYKTKEEEEYEKQKKVLNYSIITQFDNYKLIKVSDPETLAELTKHTNLCVQNIEVARKYFEDYYHFYLLTKDNMVCFIISSKGKKGAPINIATRTDVGIAKNNSYNYSGVGRVILKRNDVEVLRTYVLKIIEKLEGIKYEVLFLPKIIEIIPDKYEYYKKVVKELENISSQILNRTINDVKENDVKELNYAGKHIYGNIILLSTLFSPKEGIDEYISIAKSLILNTKFKFKERDFLGVVDLYEYTNIIIGIHNVYRKYFLREFFNRSEILNMIEDCTYCSIEFISRFTYLYAVNILNNKRFIEAEPYIAKHPEYAYKYALFVIHDRWKEAEPYIMKDPEHAYNYAKEIIKGKWRKAEPYIMQNPEYAYYYAKYIIKGRWREAEPYIFQNPKYAKDYEDFLLMRT